MAIIQMAYDKPTAIRIRDFLIKQGMTLEGAYGMLANICSESGFRSNNAQNSYMTKMGMTDESYTAQVDNGQYILFCTDRVGYGLCQWTSSGRKTGLLNYAKEQNKSIGDETMQLNYLIKELYSAYKTVFNKLKTSHDIAECAKYVMTKFERPADQSETAQNKRANYGLQLYEDLENVKEENKVGYIFKTNLANKSNYGNVRALSKIQWIVIHYTENDGDTDENNGKYFKNNIVKASAHYFVDDDSVTQSVPDNYVAWSVGDKRWSNYKTTGGAKYYGTVNNTNSLSIEICDDVKNGVIYPSAKTIENALTLAKEKMKQYNIPQERVIRHFDVSGKVCPAYWSGTSDKNEKWISEFWSKLGTATYTPPTITRPYLMKGDKGAEVKVLQENLNYLGYSCGNADGDFGTKTHNALIDFQEDYQKSHNLTVDGKYGSNSKRVLEEVVTKKKNSTTSTAKTYTVVSDDTLSKIGSKTGINWKTIAELNGIKSPYTVKIGQVLKLSEGVTTQTTSKPDTTSSNSVNYTYKGVNYSLVFNPTYYSNKYADLKNTFGTNATKLFSHFTEHGMKEGRQACEGFNVNVYKNTYVDLQKAFGNDLPKYYEHYCKYGYKEKRKAN